MSEQSKRIESKIRYYKFTSKQLIEFIIYTMKNKAHLFNIDDYYIMDSACKYWDSSTSNTDKMMICQDLWQLIDRLYDNEYQSDIEKLDNFSKYILLRICFIDDVNLITEKIDEIIDEMKEIGLNVAYFETLLDGKLRGQDTNCRNRCL